MRDRNASDAAPAPGWTISKILTRWPRAASVFMRMRMACAGCPMAAFETPAEAARAYGLEPELVPGPLSDVVEAGKP